MVQLLALATRMPVIEISDGLELTPNCIFVMPPGFHMRIEGVRVFLNEFHAWGWPTTLSGFLNSLTESLGPPSAAVILSGVGNDGSAALAGIKKTGGLTLAQSDPRWSGMPDCAIRTGHVDSVLNSAGIANALMAFAEEASRTAS